MKNYRHGVRSHFFASSSLILRLNQQLLDVLLQTLDAGFQLTPFVRRDRGGNHRSGNPARSPERLFTRHENVRHVLILGQ